ncbi:uncharacterized protein EAE97_010044 [Botrytis byssoidea]|uniref:Uncharacterized protein n=1 Tax=Botrytis byssoidea TaxID=139641 RepID=A0A9P5LW90_9HELO|nr:uncharacterized protein EAE97_010044 [Botrytis byssoidea]KAF7927369.1 hypothetical protein EAE97_010044 [Botrytis byssoidea]
MSRRISFCYLMGDLGCKNQIKLIPNNDEVLGKIIEAMALLLPENPADRELRKFTQMYPNIYPFVDTRELVLDHWQPNNKPWRMGITCCIELQHYHERWLSSIPFTVNGVLYCYNDGPFYSGASRPLKDVDRIPYEIKEIRKLLGTHRSERG